MKIYTKTGDRGTTTLFNGDRLTKGDIIFDVLGTIDELSAHLGMSIDIYNSKKDVQGATCIDNVRLTQPWLIEIGSLVATPADDAKNKEKRLPLNRVSGYVQLIESWIDDTDGRLPRLTTFICPRGNDLCSQLHIARAVCRRTERCIIKMVEERGASSLLEHGDILAFFNRLSDWLFVLARFAELNF